MERNQEEEDDPYAHLIKFCIVSDSQEEILRQQAARIFIASPSEDKHDSTPHHDLHQTTPRVIDIDDTEAVDLGADTDPLGLFSHSHPQSQVQTDKIIDVEVEEESIPIIDICESESEANNDEISSDEVEMPSKRLKLSENGTPRNDKSSSEYHPRKDKEKSAEPMKRKETTDGENNPSASSLPRRKLTILDILKILKDVEKEKSEEKEEYLSNLSLLEVAKLNGMTFPRPRWWPEGGFEKK